MRPAFHRLIFVPCLAVVCACPLPGAAQIVVGDVNYDGTLTAVDALGALTVVVGSTLPEGWNGDNGDTNCDETLSALDALIILSQIVDSFKLSFELCGDVPHLGRSIFECAYPAFDVADGVGPKLERENGHLQSFELLFLGSLGDELPQQLDSFAGVKPESMQLLFHGSWNCLLRCHGW